MKKKISSMLLIVGMLLINYSSFGQLKRCGSDEANQRMRELHPEIVQLQQQYDSLTHRPRVHLRTDSNQVYIIPLVFHIIHNYGPEDISDEQIYDAVRILNEDYRKLNPDSNFVVPEFRSIATDAHIEFRLANLDPNGNCTNGIDRIASLKTYSATDAAKLNPWPREYYMNIWVVAKMPNGVAGYAYLPPSVSGFGALIDGVIILHDYIGSIGTSSPATSRALTHELGHTLNLEHPWGSTNSPTIACGDDGIFDTPLTKGFLTCDTNKVTRFQCNAGVVENVQNYMDYSYCSNMFTNGQRDAMQNALNNGIVGRNNLWSAQNQHFTGIDYDPPTVCGPKADFYATQQLVCMGDAITFKNKTWRGKVSDCHWAFDGGSPATLDDTSSTVTVTFSTPGWHSVSLSVSNSHGADSMVKQSYIFVSSETAAYSGDYNEGFENNGQYLNDWVVINSGNNNSKWQYSTSASVEGSASVWLNNLNNDQYDIDELISPSIDLSGTANKFFNFYYSAATNTSKVSEMTDSLSLLYSTDCGKNWKRFASLKGSKLVDGGGYDWKSYVPRDNGFWRAFSISLPVNALTGNVRFKFQFTSSGNGNDIYLDNINISDFNGVEEPAAVSQLTLFPNPASSNVQLVYNIASSANVKIELFDVMGSMTTLLSAEKQDAGEHTFTFNDGAQGQLLNGVYLIKITVDGKGLTRRLVITR